MTEPGETIRTEPPDTGTGGWRRAGIGALVDLGFLGIGLASGWFTGGEILIGAWAQTAIPLIGVPLVLWYAIRQAPDHPAVYAGEPVIVNDTTYRGTDAARVTAWFFLAHFGIFTAVLGMFSFMFAQPSELDVTSAAVIVWLLLRALAANVPGIVSDRRFLAADGYAQLASRATSVALRPYLRVLPLHLGILLLLAPIHELTTWRLDAAIVVVVVAMTFAASLWRYPTSAVSEGSTDLLAPPAPWTASSPPSPHTPPDPTG